MAAATVTAATAAGRVIRVMSEPPRGRSRASAIRRGFYVNETWRGPELTAARRCVRTRRTGALLGCDHRNRRRSSHPGPAARGPRPGGPGAFRTPGGAEPAVGGQSSARPGRAVGGGRRRRRRDRGHGPPPVRGAAPPRRSPRRTSLVFLDGPGARGRDRRWAGRTGPDRAGGPARPRDRRGGRGSCVDRGRLAGGGRPSGGARGARCRGSGRGGDAGGVA